MLFAFTKTSHHSAQVHGSQSRALAAVELTVHVLLPLVGLPLRLLQLLLLLHPSLLSLHGLGLGPACAKSGLTVGPASPFGRSKFLPLPWRVCPQPILLNLMTHQR